MSALPPKSGHRGVPGFVRTGDVVAMGVFLACLHAQDAVKFGVGPSRREPGRRRLITVLETS
jgi:hypothetical protein